MKTWSYISLMGMVLASAIFVGCRKSNEFPSPTAYESTYVNGKVWKQTGGVNLLSGSPWGANYVADCENDDFLIFNSNRQVVYHNGATSCSKLGFTSKTDILDGIPNVISGNAFNLGNSNFTIESNDGATLTVKGSDNNVSTFMAVSDSELGITTEATSGTVTLKINHKFGGQNLLIGDTYKINNQDDLVFKSLQYSIGNVVLHRNGDSASYNYPMPSSNVGKSDDPFFASISTSSNSIFIPVDNVYPLSDTLNRGFNTISFTIGSDNNVGENPSLAWTSERKYIQTSADFKYTTGNTRNVAITSDIGKNGGNNNIAGSTFSFTMNNSLIHIGDTIEFDFDLGTLFDGVIYSNDFPDNSSSDARTYTITHDPERKLREDKGDLIYKNAATNSNITFVKIL